MTRKLVVSATLATAAVLGVAGTALAQGGPDPVLRHDRDGHPLFGILLMCAVAAAAIIGTWFVIRRGSAPAAALAPVSPTANAEAILAERLARSEISPEDYNSTLAALRGTGVIGDAG